MSTYGWPVIRRLELAEVPTAGEAADFVRGTNGLMYLKNSTGVPAAVSSSISGAPVLSNWAASIAYDAGALVLATVAVDSFEVGEVLRSGSARTSSTVFDAAEAAFWTSITPNSGIQYAEIQNVSATDRLLGRSAAGAGIVEEITCTSFGRALIDDTSVAAQRTTLGLGSLALLNYASVLGSGVDLNTIVAPGYYFHNGGDTSTNAPTGQGFRYYLAVIQGLSGFYHYQELRGADATIWTRQTIDNGTNWTAWVSPGGLDGVMVTKAAQAASSTVELLLTFTTADTFDTAAYHDPAGANPERITVPRTGKYRLDTLIEFDANANGTRQIGYRIGTDATTVILARGSTTALGTCVLNASRVIPMTSGALGYLTLYALQDSGVNLNVSANSVASLTWLGV